MGSDYWRLGSTASGVEVVRKDKEPTSKPVNDTENSVTMKIERTILIDGSKYA